MARASAARGTVIFHVRVVVTAATGNAFDIKGSGVDVRGALIALWGKATVSGAGARLRRGVVGFDLALVVAPMLADGGGVWPASERSALEAGEEHRYELC